MSMKPDTLRRAAITLYGKRGWQTGLASGLHVDPSTVRRWASGQVPIPGPVEVAVELLLEKKQREDEHDQGRPQ